MNNRVLFSSHPIIRNSKMRSGLVAAIPSDQLGYSPALPAALIIWRQAEAGLFSVIGTVLRSLEVAEWLGAVPIVDTMNFSTAYSRSSQVDLWNELFEPPGGMTIDQITAASQDYRIFFTDGGHPAKETVDPERLDVYRDYWFRYIQVRPRILNEIETRLSSIRLTERTLGLHFRGGDMRTAPRHPLPPTLNQLRQKARTLLDSAEMDTIYLATNVPGAMSALKKTFGDRVIPAPRNLRDSRETGKVPFSSSRTMTSRIWSSQHDNGENGAVRSVSHAVDALIDVVALSRCGGLVCGDSNVSLFSQVIAQEPHRFVVKIENGQNSTSRIPASLKRYVRAVLPPRLGGFS